MVAADKKERLTKEETVFILENYKKLSVADMAEKLCRAEETIQECIKKKTKGGGAKRQVYRTGESILKEAHYWTKVKSMLFEDEVKYFEKQWAAYSSQFGGVSEILPTDENMIVDLILFDIFSNRSLVAKKNALENIANIRVQIDEEMSKDKDVRDRDLVSKLNEQMNSFRSTLIELTKEHMNYQDKKDAKLKDLKATREQRFKQIQESKRDFFELLRELDDVKTRQKEGRLVEKVRLAAQKVTHDLQLSKKYEDGEYDSPFLIAEETQLPEGVSNE